MTSDEWLMNLSAPNLISVTTIRKDGSRRMLHPADVNGRFTRGRRGVAVVLVAVYGLLPWISVKGNPAVFLDVAQRRFHFFGLTLAAQDLWLGFFIITGLAFSLFYVTSFFGRVWCGWTCPYTVFLEHGFRRVERWIEGDAVARRKLEAAPWSVGKVVKRVAKHAVYVALSALVAHVFLAYFVSLRQLYAWMQGPPGQHVLAFGTVVVLTGVLYFCFSWFREQFCIMLCPYGRLQSALTDDHTVVIGYDRKRGEPRGRRGQGAGDCVSCNRCVQVCPTGIDIRNGLQLECIGCAACVDACDDVMRRLKRPAGLVRYDSLTGLQGGRTRYLRPRTWLYSGLLALGVAVFALALGTLKPMRMTSTRMTGAPFFVSEGLVRNQFQVRFINKRNEEARYRLELGRGAPQGMRLGGAESGVVAPAFGEVLKTAVLTLPQQSYVAPVKVTLVAVEERPQGSEVAQEVEFLGPDPRMQNDDYLNPQNYLR